MKAMNFNTMTVFNERIVEMSDERGNLTVYVDEMPVYLYVNAPKDFDFKENTYFVFDANFFTSNRHKARRGAFDEYMKKYFKATLNEFVEKKNSRIEFVKMCS